MVLAGPAGRRAAKTNRRHRSRSRRGLSAKDDRGKIGKICDVLGGGFAYAMGIKGDVKLPLMVHSSSARAWDSCQQWSLRRRTPFDMGVYLSACKLFPENSFICNTTYINETVLHSCAT